MAAKGHYATVQAEGLNVGLALVVDDEAFRFLGCERT
jgi:hypothetical protein